MKEAVIAVCVLIYDAFLIAGTAYLVEAHGWSMWTFLLAMCFFMTTKSKEEKPVQ